jgi:hypothetical protein
MKTACHKQEFSVLTVIAVNLYIQPGRSRLVLKYALNENR